MTFEEFASRKYYYERIMKYRALAPDEADDYAFALQEEAKAIATIRMGLAIARDEAERKAQAEFELSLPADGPRNRFSNRRHHPKRNVA